jgi:hypothetical protein
MMEQTPTTAFNGKMTAWQKIPFRTGWLEFNWTRLVRQIGAPDWNGR